MLTSEEFRRINSIIDTIEKSVDGEVIENSSNPQDVFDQLFLNSEKSPILVEGQVEAESRNFDDINMGDGADCYFGVDASTTKIIETVSGITFCISNARTGVTQRISNKKCGNIGNKSTIVIGLKDKNDVLNKQKFKKEIDEISDDTAEVKSVFIEDIKMFQDRNRVKDVSRTESEISQLEKTLQAAPSDSIVFIDGSIYPRTLIRSLMKIESSDIKEMEILEKYGELVRSSDLPVIGVVKNPRSEEILRAYSSLLGEDEEVQWKDDYTLMIDYLRTQPGERECSFTSEWFIEKDMSFLGSRLPIWEEDLDMRRSFFYCHVASNNITLRFETPNKYINDYNSDEEIMNMCVYDVLMSDGLPESVGIADSKASISANNSNRISRNAKDSLRRIVKRYNRDERNYDGDYQ